MRTALPTFDLSAVLSAVSVKLGTENLEVAEREYRRFLFLCKMHPDTPIVPSLLVDELWHQHILDTRKYAQDCQGYFGYFLHHASGDPVTDTMVFQELFLDTRRLYQMYFELGEEDAFGAAICQTVGGDLPAPPPQVAIAICQTVGGDLPAPPPQVIT